MLALLAASLLVIAPFGQPAAADGASCSNTSPLSNQCSDPTPILVTDDNRILLSLDVLAFEGHLTIKLQALDSGGGTLTWECDAITKTALQCSASGGVTGLATLHCVASALREVPVEGGLPVPPVAPPAGPWTCRVTTV